MRDFNINIDNLNDIDNLLRYLDKLSKTLESGTSELPKVIEERARDVYYRNIDKTQMLTGDLVANAYVENLSEGGNIEIVVGNRSKHAQYVEHGTGIWHTDENYSESPRAKFWLVPEDLLTQEAIDAYGFKPYGTTEGGKTIYQVFGQVPQFFFLNTYEELANDMDDILKGVFKDI